MMRGRMRGFTAIGLLVLFVSLVVFAALMNPLGTIIGDAEAYLDPTAYLLIRLIPFIAAAAIAMIPLRY